MKIMVFLQGTVLMHETGVGKTPEERIKQVQEKEPSVAKYETYVPVGHAVEKIKKWHEQGAEILYLCSQDGAASAKTDEEVLKKFDFPVGPVLYKESDQTYAQIVEKAMPDVLVEDDCESIGGEIRMTYPHVDPAKQEKIKAIVVKEFTGIDDLPDNLEELKEY